jgi:endonuclease/exonuclease/phosphatase family metal-dependent hydrolase
MIPGRTLRLLTYNIQVGIHTTRPHEYFTRGWRHVWPWDGRQAHLDRIAAVLEGYDVVALQEVDAGSFRCAFLNQAEYLARTAGFAWWHLQVNRAYGVLAQHGIAVLSRFPPSAMRECRLPGLPGRGALMLSLGAGPRPLTVLAVHLALGAGTRQRQLRYIGRLVERRHDVVVMGDMNCRAAALERHRDLRRRGLRVTTRAAVSYPSWRPRRNLDHVLVTPGLTVRHVEVLEHAWSDHLPVAVEIELPEDVAVPYVPPRVHRDSATLEMSQ